MVRSLQCAPVVCLLCLTGPPLTAWYFSTLATTLACPRYTVCVSRRSRNTLIHGGQLFAPRTNEYQGGSPLKTDNSPKLSLVDLTRYDFLFKRTVASRNILKKFLEGLLEASDQKGTIACAIPRPWYEKGALVHGT